MKGLEFKKTHILITVYIFLIVTELIFYVPYHNIQIFKSNQNVPHTEIVGSGYATMDDITNDNAYIDYHNKTSTGKIVNTPQLFLNVSITTVLAIVIYFLLKKDEEVNELPILDINALAFLTDEEIKQVQRDYARKMAEYVKRNKLF